MLVLVLLVLVVVEMGPARSALALVAVSVDLGEALVELGLARVSSPACSGAWGASGCPARASWGCVADRGRWSRPRPSSSA